MIDPKLQDMFSQAGIQLGGGGGSSPNKGKLPTGPNIDDNDEDQQNPENDPEQLGEEEQLEANEEQDQNGGGQVESDIFRSIVEGGPFKDPATGEAVADFSFLPQQFRNQIKQIILKAIDAAGSGLDQTSVG